MAKGMLSVTVALLLSAICAVEGQSAASGAAAAGGGAASAATAAAAGGGYGGPGYGGGGYSGPGYGGGGYLPYSYRRQYVYNSVPNTYLPYGGRYSSSYVNAAKKIKSASGVGIIDDLLNDFIDAKLLNNANG